jgi:2,4-dienoyl-CoA reductase-like NADH-dependent reductase (Old Yellow Enzyme family)
MGTGLIDMGQVTAREAAFQEERARGGVGLMITGAAVVHPTLRVAVPLRVSRTAAPTPIAATRSTAGSGC